MMCVVLLDPSLPAGARCATGIAPSSPQHIPPFHPSAPSLHPPPPPPLINTEPNARHVSELRPWRPRRWEEALKLHSSAPVRRDERRGGALDTLFTT